MDHPLANPGAALLTMHKPISDNADRLDALSAAAEAPIMRQIVNLLARHEQAMQEIANSLSLNTKATEGIADRLTAHVEKEEGFQSRITTGVTLSRWFMAIFGGVVTLLGGSVISLILWVGTEHLARSAEESREQAQMLRQIGVNTQRLSTIEATLADIMRRIEKH